MKAIDAIVQTLSPGENDPPFQLSLQDAEAIIDHISDSLVMDPGFSWDVKAFKASLDHLAKSNPDKSQRGQVACLVRRDRNLAKVRSGDRLQSAPDSLVERQQVAQFQGNRPALFLYRQNGKTEDGWNGCPFWWPVLRAPSTSPTVIFASDIVD